MTVFWWCFLQKRDVVKNLTWAVVWSDVWEHRESGHCSSRKWGQSHSHPCSPLSASGTTSVTDSAWSQTLLNTHTNREKCYFVTDQPKTLRIWDCSYMKIYTKVNLEWKSRWRLLFVRCLNLPHQSRSSIMLLLSNTLFIICFRVVCHPDSWQLFLGAVKPHVNKLKRTAIAERIYCDWFRKQQHDQNL